MKKDVKSTIVHYFVDKGEIETAALIKEHLREYPSKKVCINATIESNDKFRIVIGSFFNQFGFFEFKIKNTYDYQGFEIQCIEYDKDENVIRRMEYENYPNGETKWMYVYDDEGNLINKEFFEED